MERTRKMLMNQGERQLVFFSKVIDNHPNIFKVLYNYPKLDEDMAKSGILDEQILNFFKYGWKDLYTNASAEWVQTDYYKEVVNEYTCELCGNSHLKHVSEIMNKETKKKLKVGSECIKKFEKIDMSKEDRKKYNITKRDTEEINRKVKINSEFPGLDENISKWRKKINSNKILLPQDIEEKAISLNNEIYELYNNYIKRKQTKDVFIKMKELINSLTNQFLIIEQFNKDNQDDKYICNLALKNWILSHQKKEVLEKIKTNKCRIDNDTIKLIYFKDFVDKFLDEILISLTDKRISYFKNENHYIYFKFKRDNFFSFIVYCTYKHFMSICIIEDFVIKIQPNMIYSILTIQNIDENETTVINFINTLLENTIYELEYLKKGFLNYVKHEPKKSKEYSKAGFEFVLKQLQNIIFLEKDFIIKHKYISIFEKVTWENIEQNEQNQVDNRLLQKDFNNY